MDKIKDCDLSHSKKEILFHVDSSLPWVKYQYYVQPIHLKVVGGVNWQKHYMKIKKIWETFDLKVDNFSLYLKTIFDRNINCQ